MEMGLDSLSKLKSYDIVKSAIVMVMIVNPIMKLNIRVNSFSNHQAQPQALVSSQKYACTIADLTISYDFNLERLSSPISIFPLLTVLTVLKLSIYCLI
jgi:hypothetical protein